MSPTPTPVIPTPAPMPDHLTGSVGTYPSGLDTAIENARGAGTPGSLDAAFEAAGIGVTSPWLPLAWTALAVITVLAVAALAITVWKTREGDTRSRYRQEITDEREARREALRLEDQRARREAAAKVTFTPAAADTDDLPAPPLGEER